MYGVELIDEEKIVYLKVNLLASKVRMSWELPVLEKYQFLRVV